MQNLKNEELQSYLWIDFETDDLEEFAKATQSWQMDFVKLDTQPFKAKVQQIIFPEIQIGHAQFYNHLDQKGVSPNGMWTFVIMGEDASMFKFNHTETLTTSTMVIYSPGYEINAVSYEGFHVYTFSISESHFKNITQTLGLNRIEDKLSKIDRVELDTEQVISLRNLLKDRLNAAATSPYSIMSQEGKRLLLHYLPVKFLKEIGDKVGCARHKIVQEKDMIFMEARSYMHTHLDKPITISDIAKKFKISERSLRNYFMRELNISPKQYLITLRLTKINYILKNEKEIKGLIEQTARRFGFNHMGQFAQSYKDFFGELPSETLSKS